MTPSALRQSRKALGLSVEDLADALGLGRRGGTTVREWESGRREPIPQFVEDFFSQRLTNRG